MRYKTTGPRDARWIAYDAAQGEHEWFDTYEDAEAWLKDMNDEGIAEETLEGMSYIAKVTHRSTVDVTARRDDYHKHTDECPEDCDKEEWPYDTDYDWVGVVRMVPVEES